MHVPTFNLCIYGHIESLTFDPIAGKPHFPQIPLK